MSRRRLFGSLRWLVESGIDYDGVFVGFALLLAGFLVGLGVAARFGKLPS